MAVGNPPRLPLATKSPILVRQVLLLYRYRSHRVTELFIVDQSTLQDQLIVLLLCTSKKIIILTHRDGRTKRQRQKDMDRSGVLLPIWISRDAIISWQRSAPTAIIIDQTECKQRLIRIPIYYTIDPSSQILCGNEFSELLKDLELQWLAYRAVLFLPFWVPLVKSAGCHKYWNGVSRTNCSFTILVRPSMLPSTPYWQGWDVTKDQW